MPVPGKRKEPREGAALRKTKKERYFFSDEEKKQILSEIACYFRENHDLELGMIGTGGIFDFFLGVMGDHIYNQALDDANRFFQNYAENMEADCYSLYKDVR